MSIIRNLRRSSPHKLLHLPESLLFHPLPLPKNHFANPDLLAVQSFRVLRSLSMQQSNDWWIPSALYSHWPMREYTCKDSLHRITVPGVLLWDVNKRMANIHLKRWLDIEMPSSLSFIHSPTFTFKFSIKWGVLVSAIIPIYWFPNFNHSKPHGSLSFSLIASFHPPSLPFRLCSMWHHCSDFTWNYCLCRYNFVQCHFLYLLWFSFLISTLHPFSSLTHSQMDILSHFALLSRFFDWCEIRRNEETGKCPIVFHPEIVAARDWGYPHS